MSLQLALMGTSGSDDLLLIGATRTGLLYAFNTPPPQQQQQQQPQPTFMQPTPMVNYDTGLLFEARVIGAIPIGYQWFLRAAIDHSSLID